MSYVSGAIGIPPQAAFDDGGVTERTTLQYEWSLLENRDTAIRIRVHLALVAGALNYFGESHATRASDGDFSFVKRFALNESQKENALIVLPDRENKSVPMASFLGPHHLEANLTATVFLGNQTIRWDDSEREGTWILWTDPDMVPFGSNRTLPMVRLWPSGPIEGTMTVENTETSRLLTRNVHESAPGLESWVRWTSPWVTLSGASIGTLKSFDQILTPVYEPSTGLLAGDPSGMFVDDTLISHLGLLYYGADLNNTMIVSSTNVPGLEAAIHAKADGAKNRPTPGPESASLLAALCALALVLSRRRKGT